MLKEYKNFLENGQNCSFTNSRYMFFFIELGGMVEGVVVDVAAGRFPIPSGVEVLLYACHG